MPDYRVTFARSARKELENLDRQLALRILERIEGLTTESRPPGVRKLRGAKDLWRLRVGDYRVIYTIDDDARVLDVVAVRHRSEAYR